MKKAGKIYIVFQILVLYCFVISTYSTRVLASDMSFQTGRSSKGSGFSPIEGVDLFALTTKTENVVAGQRNLPVFSFKNHPNDYLAHRKGVESYLLNNCSEYIFFAENRIVRLRPTDLIFPFHYFW